VKLILAAMKANPERCELHIQASAALGLMSGDPLGKKQIKEENGVDWLLKNLITHPHLNLMGLWSCLKNVFGDENTFWRKKTNETTSEENKLMKYLIDDKEDWIDKLDVLANGAKDVETKSEALLLLDSLVQWIEGNDENSSLPNKTTIKEKVSNILLKHKQ